jgi:hypothetical protein
VPIEITITLLLLYSLARSYKAILMPGISLIRSTLLSLARSRSARHAIMLTQSDFRVSEIGAFARTSAWKNSPDLPLNVQMRDIEQWTVGNNGSWLWCPHSKDCCRAVG